MVWHKNIEFGFILKEKNAERNQKKQEPRGADL